MNKTGKATIFDRTRIQHRHSVSRRHLVGGVLAAAAIASLGLGLAMPHGFAQSSEPLRIIVPYNAGGATDRVMRIVVDQMAENLNRRVLVENKPGGASTVGLSLVAQAAPDGNTLGAANIALAVNPFVMKDLPFDPQKDFVTVGMVDFVPLVLSAHPSLKARSVQDLIDLAKAQPDELSYASAGIRTSSHLAMELFTSMAGIKMRHIPYKGGKSQLAAVGGEVNVLFSTITTTKQAYDSGTLIPLGVSTLKRDPSLPDVPTIAESGVPDFEMGDWVGLVAPKGTPADAVKTINEALVAALEEPEVRERLEMAGVQVRTSTPEGMAQHLESELAKWEKVVATAGIDAK